jgi:hypothetical protein
MNPAGAAMKPTAGLSKRLRPSSETIGNGFPGNLFGAAICRDTVAFFVFALSTRATFGLLLGDT